MDDDDEYGEAWSPIEDPADGLADLWDVDEFCDVAKALQENPGLPIQGLVSRVAHRCPLCSHQIVVGEPCGAIKFPDSIRRVCRACNEAPAF